MRALSLMTLLAALVLPTVVFAEIQTFTATHTYILGDHDSKDDARQRCLLEAKRKILEQAGVYIESESEVKNFDLTKDKITSFAAAVMQIKDTKDGRPSAGLVSGKSATTLTFASGPVSCCFHSDQSVTVHPFSSAFTVPAAPPFGASPQPPVKHGTNNNPRIAEQTFIVNSKNAAKPSNLSCRPQAMKPSGGSLWVVL